MENNINSTELHFSAKEIVNITSHLFGAEEYTGERNENEELGYCFNILLNHYLKHNEIKKLNTLTHVFNEFIKVDKQRIYNKDCSKVIFAGFLICPNKLPEEIKNKIMSKATEISLSENLKKKEHTINQFNEFIK